MKFTLIKILQNYPYDLHGYKRAKRAKKSKSCKKEQKPLRSFKMTHCKGAALNPNPFTPSFGKVPPILAGRDELIATMEQALKNGGGDPNLCSLFIGPRGVGKTALMSYLAEIAPQYGWVAANVSARRGMLEDIIERATDAADQFIEKEKEARVRSVSIGQLFGVEWEYRNPASGNWRTRMNKLLDALSQYDIGLLITVDEVRTDIEEMLDFASTYQHFVRENKRVALIMAGLPSNVSSLVSDKSVSFLRRATSHRLGKLISSDVALAFEQTVENAGKHIDREAVDAAVHTIEGSPYLMQLVGFRSWQASQDAETITTANVRRGSQLAKQDFVNGVVKDTCNDLSDMDMAFLMAMLEDRDSSSISDIAGRLEKTPSYVRVYRKRLEEQGVIESKGRGKVVYSLPYLREYLEGEQ